MKKQFIYPLYTDTVPPISQVGIEIKYDLTVTYRPYDRDGIIFHIEEAFLGKVDVTELVKDSEHLLAACESHWNDMADDEPLCGTCGGTGEGNHDGSSCGVCLGSGKLRREG